MTHGRPSASAGNSEHPGAPRRLALDPLLAGDDTSFLRAAYRQVLGRDADPAGLDNHLRNLHSGRHTRAEILAALIDSPEGRQRPVEVDGLRARVRWHRLLNVPVLGHLLALGATLRQLPQQLRQQPVPVPRQTADQAARDATAAQRWDAFYQRFEDVFRGSRADIRERVIEYLPLVHAAHAGRADRPILDIGSGRGEWLELLRDEGLSARGVDTNSVAVTNCQKLGLDTVEGDAFDLLRALPDNSLGAVTAFHVIEHIPYEALGELFDEVLRVLKPGGLAIFETPNPENLDVGAHWFWFDPTHIRPLPPPPTRFLVESRGFVQAEILRLTRHRGDAGKSLAQLPDTHPDAAVVNPVVARVAQMLYAAPDYAIVAHKAGVAA